MMCVGPEIALIAGTALSAGSALYSGYQQYEIGKYQQAQANADAEARQGAARVEAERIRKITERQQASARAALAGSGVNVNEGTALNINEDIEQRGEQDALTAMLQGSYDSKAIRAGGALAATRGRSALATGALEAGGTAAMGRWRYQEMKP